MSLKGGTVLRQRMVLSGDASETSRFYEVKRENPQRAFPPLCFDQMMFV